MNSRIEGDIESVRNVRLRELEQLLDTSCEPGAFLPAELVCKMAEMTALLSREIAVYLDRKNHVLKIVVGDRSRVLLPETDSRKGEHRLCGIRLLHTHPNGTLYPSEKDLRSLKSLRLDAMIVIGVQKETGRPCGASASLLSEKESVRRGGFGEPVLYGPVSESRFDFFDNLFQKIALLDQAGTAPVTENKKERERAVLVGVIPDSGNAPENPLAELCELARTAGASVADVMTQRRAFPDPRYYIGSGSASELAEKVRASEADLVIFDDELTPSQIRNLEDIANVRVIDRTALILDIFAGRAKSREGRLQVELAQQKYRLPRLTGKGIAMSRLGGGIGTRGPGETKLESDRRHINRKIHTLEAQLKEVAERRAFLRQERKKRDSSVIAVVGYTNAGKSTLVNSLCNAEVFVEDELFATLDTSVRKLVTKENRDFLLVDTVGFIRKLPHDLVEAFKATLEEAVYADLLLHVVDVSDPNYLDCIRVVEGILEEIGAGARPRYLVLNKTDRLPQENDAPVPPEIRRGYGRVIPVSAFTGAGLPELRDEIIRFFTRVQKHFSFFIPYNQGAVLARVHRDGKIEAEEYAPDGTFVRGFLPGAVYAELKDFEVRP